MENRRLTDKEVKRLHEIDPYIDLKLNLSLKLISINSRAEEIAKRSKSKKLVAEVKEIPSFLGNTFKVFLKRPDEKNASICIRFYRGYKKPKIGEKESIPVPEIFVDFFPLLQNLQC